MIAGITASTRRFQGGGFVIKTTNGVVAAIEGTGQVQGTGVSVDANGVIDGYNSLEEVVSWPEEKPDWLEGNNISFYGAEYLTKVPDTVPAWITDMSEMFYQCSSFNQDISGWDTSNVTNMADMFSYCSDFNQDLSGWDTSNVTDMSSMFLGCSSFNQDLSGWDTGNVRDMADMFSYCSIFNGDLSEWDTGNVTIMSDMFYRCSSFNQDISGWDTSNVTSMATMFYGCSSFNQDISGWDVSNVTDMRAMLRECSSFNQDLSGWCVIKISSNPFGFSTNTPSWTLPKPVWGTCPQEGGGGGMDVILPDENGVYYAERSIVQGDSISTASFYEWQHLTTPDGDLAPITKEQANAPKPGLGYDPYLTFADPRTIAQAAGISSVSEISCMGGVGTITTSSSGSGGPELISEKCRIDIHKEGKPLYIPELDISICIFNGYGGRLKVFVIDPVPLPSRKAYDNLASRITVQFQRPSGAFVTLTRTVEHGGLSLYSNNSTVRSELPTGSVFKITVT